MKLFLQLHWDAIIPREGAPIIVLPEGGVPRGAMSCPAGIFIRQGARITYLVKSENLAKKISKHQEIVIAEADEGLLRQTKIRHHWMKRSPVMETR